MAIWKERGWQIPSAGHFEQLLAAIGLKSEFAIELMLRFIITNTKVGVVTTENSLRQ